MTRKRATKQGNKEVEIRKEDTVVLTTNDPILQLGDEPVDDTVTDASENHDVYIYGE
jgi:hypothetical protein